MKDAGRPDGDRPGYRRQPRPRRDRQAIASRSSRSASTEPRASCSTSRARPTSACSRSRKPRGDPLRGGSGGEHHLRHELRRSPRRRGPDHVIATGFDSSRKRDSVRREAGAATPGAGYSQRMDTRTSCGPGAPAHSLGGAVPVYARGAGTYGATGALERTPVAVPIQTSQSVRRPPVDRRGPPTTIRISRSRASCGASAGGAGLPFPALDVPIGSIAEFSAARSLCLADVADAWPASRAGSG